MVNLHTIVLTKDEEIHIARCLNSVRKHSKTITVIDSGSMDSTCLIAREYGAKVIKHTWKNYAEQFNFALSNVPEGTDWILRIDADEYFDAVGIHLNEFLGNQSSNTAGVFLNRQIYFMGRRIRWGGIEPSWQLRIFRFGKGHCENRWMDEHITVTGETIYSPFQIIDHNLKSVDWWISKHNSYASREAIDFLNLKGEIGLGVRDKENHPSRQAARKRIIKERIYYSLPGSVRVLLYFFLRYVIFLGFMDGVAGYYFHFFQALWYRTLVDAKVREIRVAAKSGGIEKAIEAKTGISLRDVKKM